MERFALAAVAVLLPHGMMGSNLQTLQAGLGQGWNKTVDRLSNSDVASFYFNQYILFSTGPGNRNRPDKHENCPWFAVKLGILKDAVVGGVSK